MTELERHLMDGFQKLSEQYAADMKRLQWQNEQLAGRVEILTKQVQSLTKALGTLNGKLDELAES